MNSDFEITCRTRKEGYEKITKHSDLYIKEEHNLLRIMS